MMSDKDTAVSEDHMDSQEPSSIEERRHRADLSEHEPVLEEFFKAGMQNYSTAGNKRKVAELAQRFGVEEKKIKNWIGNRKRKARKTVGVEMEVEEPSLEGMEAFLNTLEPQVMGSHPFSSRNKTGYGLFMGYRMKGGNGSIGEASRDWRKLTQENPVMAAKFEEAAKGFKTPAPEELSNAVRTKAVLKLERELEEVVTKLKSLKCEVFTIAYDTSRQLVFQAGTPAAKEFMRSKIPSLEWEFSAGVAEGTTTSRANNNQAEAEELRQKLREELNKLARATPGLGNHFPYNMLASGRLVVDGLPPHVTLTKPRSMGLQRLKEVLGHIDSISIHVAGPSSMEEAEAEVEAEAGTSAVSVPEEDPNGSLESTETGGTMETTEATTPEGTSPCMEMLLQIQHGIEAGMHRVEQETEEEREGGRKTTERGKGKGKGTGKAKRKGKEKGKGKGKGEETYYVEKIVGTRVDKGVVLYNVKWHGYPDSQNTWEPSSNLSPEIIKNLFTTTT